MAFFCSLLHYWSRQSENIKVLVALQNYWAACQLPAVLPLRDFALLPNWVNPHDSYCKLCETAERTLLYIIKISSVACSVSSPCVSDTDFIRGSGPSLSTATTVSTCPQTQLRRGIPRKRTSCTSKLHQRPAVGVPSQAGSTAASITTLSTICSPA